MSLYPWLNYVGMIVGLLIVIYGFIGPLSIKEFRFINPFLKRIPLSRASLLALEAVENTPKGKIERGLNISLGGNLRLSHYAYDLLNDTTVNLYGTSPPSRVLKLLHNPLENAYISDDANRIVENTTKRVLYSDLEIEKNRLKSYIDKNT